MSINSGNGGSSVSRIHTIVSSSAATTPAKHNTSNIQAISRRLSSSTDSVTKDTNEDLKIRPITSTMDNLKQQLPPAKEPVAVS